MSRFLTPSVPGNETFGEAVLVPFPRFQLPQASLKTNPNKGVPSTHGIPKGGRVPQSSSGFLGTPKNFRKVLNDVDEVCGEGSQVLIIEGCPAGALGSTPPPSASAAFGGRPRGRQGAGTPGGCPRPGINRPIHLVSIQFFVFCHVLVFYVVCFMFLVLSCPCHVLVLFCHSLSNPFSFFVFCHVPCLLCRFRCFSSWCVAYVVPVVFFSSPSLLGQLWVPSLFRVLY